MQSWNDRCQDEEYLSGLKENDPEAFIPDSYLLKGATLKESVSCSFGNDCLIGIKLGKGEIGETKDDSGKIVLKPLSYSWVFCFSCNSISHLYCLGYRTQTFLELELNTPFRCRKCVTNPNNELAKQFYVDHQVEMKVSLRREKFLKTFELSDSIEEVDNSNVVDNVEDIKRKYEVEIQVLSDRCNKAEQAHNEVLTKLSECMLEIQGLKEMKRDYDALKIQMHGTTSKSRNDDERSHGHNTSTVHHLLNASIRQRSSSELHLNENLRRSKYADTGFADPHPSALLPRSIDCVGTEAPVQKPRKSFIESIEVDKLTRAERITLEQAQAQMEATEAQREIASSQNLAVIRKALPRIVKFNGDPRKWIQFKRDVDRYVNVGKYDDYEMRIHILQSLEGLALSRVQGAVDKVPFKKTMEVLTKCFGEPTRIIEQYAEDILSLRVPKDLTRDDVLLITSKILDYFGACMYADIDVPNSNQLAMHIFNQLSLLHKQLFRHKFKSESVSSAYRVIELDSLFDFLEELSEELEEKRLYKSKPDEKKFKPVQINMHSVGQFSGSTYSKVKQPDDYMFEIKDIKVNPFGYDLKELAKINKFCECCQSKGHFNLQCRKYRNMSAYERLRFVNERNLCRNCVVTSSHRSFDCKLKDGCGHKEYNDKCIRKHHITLHKAFNNVESNTYGHKNKGPENGNGGSRSGNYPKRYQRNNTKYNQQKAQTIADKGQQESTKDTSDEHEAISEASPTSDPDKLIQQAPTINELPHNQLSSFSKQNGHSVAAQTASSQRTTAVCSVSAYPEIQRTVKVFRNKFFGKKGFIEGYSVGDSAAEVTLLCDNLRQLLGLEGDKCELLMQWTDGTLKTKLATRVTLVVQGVTANSKKLTLRNCYAIPDLNLPKRSLDMDKLRIQYPYLSKIDFSSYENVSPSLLIGTQHASVFESTGKLLEGGIGKPVGIRAKLGFSVYGGSVNELNEVPYNVECIATVSESDEISKISNEKLYELYAYFCSIESLGIGNKTLHYTQKEQAAIDLLKKEMRILPNGTVQVPLVWNMDGREIPKLLNNFAMVLKRQLAHEKKLSKNPVHYKAFNDNFKKWLLNGEVRPATYFDLHNDWPNINYLPMTLTCNVNKVPPKFRNVFDASARYFGSSLNENLLKGPDLLVDLTKPLLRMRENQVAFTADIQNMFMQMEICERDQQVQRVLWRESVNDEFRIFVFNRMLFGPTSSPFTSQWVKNETADRFMGIYPKAAETIKQAMYMDDLLTSEKSVEEAIAVAKECIEIFDSMNWNLIQFQSNNLEFLKALPEANVSQGIIPLLESDTAACVTKVLGCVWDTKSDAFVFQFDKNLFIKIVKEYNHRPTKRDQCSTIARIFDVLGLISPFIIRGKILVQRSWLAELGWDDEISEKEHREWLRWLNEIENVAKIKVPRQISESRNLSQCDSVELHTFADAGGEAFAAVCYLVTTVQNQRSSNIVMAKAKVTPIRHKSRTQISEIPRLELCACLIASRLANTITKHYSHIDLRRFFWTDSEVVLRWITKPNHRLLKYAISPVEEILDKSTRDEWRFVPTKINVADIATKFKKLDFSDSNSVWFKGPEFLLLHESTWPTMPQLLEPPVVHETVMQVNTVCVSNLPISTHKLPPLDCSLLSDCMIDKFSASIKSRWLKLVRATARALNIVMDGLIPLVKTGKFRNERVRRDIKLRNENFECISSVELERAEHFIIRKLQREVYAREYECLRLNRPVNNQELKQLSVFMDSEGLIRINSRVEYPNAKCSPQYVPLIPRNHPITRAYLMYVHEEFKHIHIETQIAYVRHHYWIPQLRAALKSVQINCNYCSIVRANPLSPKMAPLPECRTNPDALPFETTGVDCMGPFVIMNHTRQKKIWVLIFVCTLTRFIHLRILNSLESISVLEAIVEFNTTLGPVRTFLSDRGTNFVGASNIIAEDRKLTMNFLSEQRKALSQHLADKYRVEWKLLPAHSPWMGGVYERLIKEVKRSIAAVLNNRKLNATTLNIALNDAAHRINNRPLTHNPVSADDEEILTPHMLAKGRSGWPYLPGLQSTSCKDIPNDRSTYRRGRAIADEMMRRFYHNYLPVLTKRVKWNKDIKPIKVGDLVLLIEPNDTRSEWRRGKVVNVYRGRDKRIRVADIMLPDRSIKKARSVQRLARIEISTRVD